MTQALTSAVAEVAKLPPAEQDILAGILLEEIASVSISIGVQWEYLTVKP